MYFISTGKAIRLISQQWEIIILYRELDACLDAVHNYTDNQRNHAKGIISKITAGVVIPLGVAAGGSGDSGNDNYPWSP